jgi:hypothetical protein
MGIKSQPVNFALERWMRLPGLPTSSYFLSRRDLFVFSGYADFTSNEPLPTLIPTGITPDLPTTPEPLRGQGAPNTDDQAIWVEYDIEELVIGPHWRTIDGVSPTVIIGGHSQVSPDVANAMGFRVQGVTNVDQVDVAAGGNRIRLSVSVAVRGGLDGKILTLAYQVMAWGRLSNPIGDEGVFFAGSSDPT